MTTLATIIDALSGMIAVRGRLDRPIAAIRYDSRVVGPNDLFVAINGPDDRALGFVDAAIRQGATTVLIDDPDRMTATASEEEPTWILVQDARIAMAEVARFLSGSPADGLRLFGITGTNGKTTVAHLLHSLFAATDRPVGLIGTLGAAIPGEEAIEYTGYTTPESPELYELLGRMKNAATTDVVMEVSSHALVLHRVYGLRFSGAVFTNISQEHLDFHTSFEEYLDAKKSIFDRLDATAYAVVNVDDVQGSRMVRDTDADVIGYGTGDSAELRIDEEQLGADGSSWLIHFSERFGGGSDRFSCRLVGRFNVMNVTAACAAALGAGLDRSMLVQAVEGLDPVPGRMQSVSLASGASAIVDYAHTPDALANVLEAARRFVPSGGNLHILFGCGGDRDRTKRPEMGRIAAEGADCLWVTSDNPRSEDPTAIIDDIVDGIARADRAYTAIPDRRMAIAAAVAAIGADDLLVVAGKGHETIQIIGSERLPFDDVAVIRQEDRKRVEEEA